MENDTNAQIAQLKKDMLTLADEMYKNNFSTFQEFNKRSKFTNGLSAPVMQILPTTCEVGDLVVVGGKLYVGTDTNVFALVGSQS